MLSPEELKKELSNRPAPSVTPEYIEARIEKVEYQRTPYTSHGTFCTITLDNGYTVTGQANCVNPENYSREVGRTVAYNNALQGLWPLFGFMLAEYQHLKKDGKS